MNPIFESVVKYNQRYQKGLKMHNLFPSIEGKCACGCGSKLEGKQTRWASHECNDRAYQLFAILKGNTGAIRKIIFERDEGFCHSCGAFDDKWEVDHIIEIREGGGACGLENLQTLCPDCHNQKTADTYVSLKEKNQSLKHLAGLVSFVANQRTFHHKAIS